MTRLSVWWTAIAASSRAFRSKPRELRFSPRFLGRRKQMARAALALVNDPPPHDGQVYLGL